LIDSSDTQARASAWMIFRLKEPLRLKEKATGLISSRWLLFIQNHYLAKSLYSAEDSPVDGLLQSRGLPLSQSDQPSVTSCLPVVFR